MARGYRDMRMINPAEKGSGARLRKQSAPRPFRVWVSGVLCVTPNPDGSPGVLVSLDGVRSGVWTDAATLPLAPLLPFDDHEAAWKPDASTTDLNSVASAIAVAIVSAARTLAARRWRGAPK